MNHNSGRMDRRTYLKTTGLATVGMAGLAGCTGGDSTGGDGGTGETTYGTLSTSVTDQPSAIGDFESLTVTIDGIWIKPAGGDDSEETDDESDEMDDESMDDGNESGEMDDESMDDGNESAEMDDESMDDGNESAEMDDESMDDGNESAEMDDESMDDEDTEETDDGEGRLYIGFDEPQEADLVQLQGSNTQLIDETEVEAREYQFLQLDVSNTVGVLTDGSDATVDTPGNAPLKFNTSFEVRANEQTRFIADFAPNRRGNGSYIIRPVATSTQVLYGDEEYSPDGSSTDGSGGNETDDTDTDGNETASEGGSGGRSNGNGNGNN